MMKFQFHRQQWIVIQIYIIISLIGNIILIDGADSCFHDKVGYYLNTITAVIAVNKTAESILNDESETEEICLMSVSNTFKFYVELDHYRFRGRLEYIHPSSIAAQNGGNEMKFVNVQYG